MKVICKCNIPLDMETWLNADKKGKNITIKKGDIFETSQCGGFMNGRAESVVTDKHD